MGIPQGYARRAAKSRGHGRSAMHAGPASWHRHFSEIPPLILQGWSPHKRAQAGSSWTSGRGLTPLLSPSQAGHSAGRRVCRDEAALPEANDEKTLALNRPQLPALLALRPYLVRHPGMLLAAVVALITSAAAMLTIPLAIRRMIDVGFAAQDGVFIDRYFITLIGIGVL